MDIFLANISLLDVNSRRIVQFPESVHSKRDGELKDLGLSREAMFEELVKRVVLALT